MLVAIGGAALESAQAGQLAVTVQTYSDPLMLNLPIPASAPQTGMWSSVQNWPLVAIHMAVLPSGKIVSYGAPQGQAVQDGRTYDVWDPSQGFGAGHVVLPGVTGVNSFCAAQAFRADGSLMISGGIFDNNQDKGSVLLNNTATAISGSGAQLAADRYYASMITQPDGSAVILGGDYPYAVGWFNPQQSIDNGWNAGMTPEVYTPASGWRSLFGANSRDAFGPDNNRFWYAHAWVAPNGKIFGISSDKMWFLDTTGSGSITTMNFKDPPHAMNSRSDIAPNTGPDSSAVMYDKGKVLQLGGNSMGNSRDNGDGSYWASRAATMIDINGSTPVVTETSLMNYPRSWLNATLLPTGKVVVTGGSSWDNYQTSNWNNVTTNESIQAEETWDPATGQWTLGPSAAVYRGYHSSAILLQSGAILSAGGGVPGPVTNMNAEVYYPPYLFTTVNGQAQLAPRPQIVSLSSNQLSHGQSVQIEMSNPDAVSQVVLVGLSEVTHSFNSGQRRYVAPFSQNGTILTAQLPNSPNDAPPGYYQLIAINGNGVPSTGAIVALGSQVATPTTVATPLGPTVPRTGISASPSGATNWQKCADENGSCTLSGTQQVRFGANNAFYYGSFTGSVACTTGVFGDPAFGATKACYVAPAAASGSGTGGSGSGGTSSGSSASGALAAPSTGGWTQIGGYSQRVAVGADGTTVVINATYSNIWQYVSDYNWKQLPGYWKSIAVRNARSMWAVGMDNGVYRFDGNNWTFVGPNASTVAVSADGTVVVTNPANEVWYKTSDDTVINWKKVPTIQATRVAVVNANSLWFVGLNGHVFRTDFNGNYTQLDFLAKEIAASADGTITVTSANDQSIWQKTGDNTNNAWTELTWWARAISVASGGAGRAIHIGIDNNIYRY